MKCPKLLQFCTPSKSLLPFPVGFVLGCTCPDEAGGNILACASYWSSLTSISQPHAGDRSCTQLWNAGRNGVTFMCLYSLCSCSLSCKMWSRGCGYTFTQQLQELIAHSTDEPPSSFNSRVGNVEARAKVLSL